LNDDSAISTSDTELLALISLY